MHRRMSYVALVACVVGASACQSAEPEGQRASLGESDEAPASSADAGAHSDGHDPGDHPDPATEEAVGLPCDVAEVLAEHCWHCHGSTVGFGAPMSLVTHEDLTRASVSDPTVPVYAKVGARIHDSKAPMPPPPHGEIDAKDLAILDAFVAASAPKSDEDCGPLTPDDGEHNGRDTFDFSQCSQRVELRAHGTQDANDATPFALGQDVDNRYECFYFKMPWQGKAQALSVFPLIDDARVLHHWLLYTEEAGPYQDGGHEECNGVHPNATLVTGWAPGGEGLIMPENVGLYLPEPAEDTFFILELHYNNQAKHPDALDRSGAEVCTTDKLRENVAGVHWLGTENLLIGAGEQKFTGTCKPNISEPVHILGFSPHMHQLGRRMQTSIERVSGGTEMVFDKPFAFDSQAHYPQEVIVNPGDVLKTTCTFDNDSGTTVFFGEKTSDEMCYQFTLAYPLGAFNTGGDLLLLPGSVTGDNKCMR